MNPEQIFRKSPKGREEIEKRTLRLESRRRSLLILVDGQLTAAEIASKAPHLENPMGMFQALLSEGFIEHADGSLPSTAPEPAAVSASRTRSLEELKRAASREIERLLGPGGDAIAMKIEQCETLEQFTSEAHKARDALANFLGARQAEAFWKAIGS
ncbi:hypothetical protein [Usitatibacter palustris]|uniref:Uncharacterized protein n=1 Tax=Usitatibacter palustris TaxID=2732487 RepID=A0A6M4H4A3_9PROT|nr:hypothetical protein [Usitatibacter palustris]QJR14431.1 hypothetical protein DSM104440_01227 [Usitatibacter palustris]